MFLVPFEDIIWKIRLDEKEKILILELRNPEKHKVDFTAVDLLSKKMLWKDIRADESWWLGVESARNGVTLLHGYKDPELPDHKGIAAVNSRTGKLIWKNDQLSFNGYAGSDIIASENNHASDVENYFLLEENSGKVKEKLSASDFLKKLSGVFREKQKSEIVNGLHFSEEHEYFKKIEAFVAGLKNHQAKSAADYLEYGKFVIISYYIYENNKLSNFLLVTNEEAEEIFFGKIAEDLPGAGMDTFFLFGDQLIFIKDKTILVIIDLKKVN